MAKGADGAILLAPDALQVFSIEAKDGEIVFSVGAVRSKVPCPECGKLSGCVRSQYVRTIYDLPWHGCRVTWVVRTRRFRCGNPSCQRKIFVERLPGVRTWARRTERMKAALTELAFALGGEAGARLARQLGMPVSPDTLLRLLHAAPVAPASTPRVLGVDDWAMRRGAVYGTILVNLETRQPVDLLPDRDGQTLQRWLLEHPGVTIISRDRAGNYAEAARLGAPLAVQVADRWHLIKNLCDALARLMVRHDQDVRKALRKGAEDEGKDVQTCVAAECSAPSPLTPRQRAQQEERRARKLARVEEVQTMADKGVSLSAIARATGLDRKTVRRYIRHGAPPMRRQPRRSILEPFKPYLVQRWQDGCHNAQALFRELQTMGYKGGLSVVKGWVRRLRDRPSNANGERLPIPGPRSLAYLLTSDAEPLLVAEITAAVPEVKVAQELCLGFLSMVRGRRADELESWLEAVEAAGIRELLEFAKGIRKDMNAVRAALALPWSQGAVEGNIHRLKLVKRQMYGRGSFDLLRKRFLRAI